MSKMGMTLARFVASGAGLGYAPVAPGTVASAVALVLGAGILWISPILLVLAAVVAVVGGVWAVRHTRVEGDPGWVVVDEFAGQWIALLGVGQVAPVEVLGAFLVFRGLDICKPGPIGWADRQHGPVGLMADDVIAGVMAAIILYFLRPYWTMLPW